MTAAATGRPIRILHLEDSEVDHALVKLALSRSGLSFDMVRVETLQAFLECSRSGDFDLILADYRLPGFTALEAWETLQQQRPHPPFVLLTGAIGESAAVDAMHRGISDYVLKDDLGRLEHVISRSIEVWRARIEKDAADLELAASQRRLAELTEHLQTSIEQERAAIAREIHDDVGGALTAAKFDLAWIGRHAQDVATQQHVATATEMLQHALEASQRIMMNLRPPILDQGLVAAVQWLASNFERRTGVLTRFQSATPSIELPKQIELVAYRTAQEALTNISKHAQCDHVRIDLTDGEGVLTLEISDNGKGIAKALLDKPKAFGLKGLRERAKTVGGWLDVSSKEGFGASVILSVPLRETSSPHMEGWSS